MTTKQTCKQIVNDINNCELNTQIYYANFDTFSHIQFNISHDIYVDEIKTLLNEYAQKLQFQFYVTYSITTFQCTNDIMLYVCNIFINTHNSNKQYQSKSTF